MLEVSRLGIEFGGIRAVDGLDLKVGERDIVGLIGPNGAGKTTVFNLVTGIYKPTHGTIVFEGRTIAGLRPHEVTRRGVARTFQNIRLFRQLAVTENVLVGFHPHAGYGLASALLRRQRFFEQEAALRRRAAELLDLMGLAGRANELAGNLPYGDQRRLEIARALAAGPRLLLLDEPAAGMSRQERSRLMELIGFIRDQFQIAILLIEHDMRVVMGVCERVAVLDHGCPIAEGTPEAIQAHPAVIEAYLGRPEDVQPLRQRAHAPASGPRDDAPRDGA